MGLEYTHRAVQWLAADAPTVQYTIAGLGFTPKAVRCYYSGISSANNATSNSLNMRRGIGLACVSGPEQMCMAAFSEDNVALSNCGEIWRNDRIASLCTGDGVDEAGELTIVTWGADGLTLEVTTSPPVDMTLFFDIWGGDAITLTDMVTISEPGVIGDADFTMTGFTADADDQICMFVCSQTSASAGAPTEQSSGMAMGFAKNRIETCVLVSSADDQSTTTTDTECLGRQNREPVSMLSRGGGSINAEADFQWITNGFRLSWTSVSGASRRSIALGIKGGRWAVGGLTVDASVLNGKGAVTQLPFTPCGVLTIGHKFVEQTDGAEDNHDRLGLGSCDRSLNQRCQTSQDKHNIATVEINLTINYNAVWAGEDFTATGQHVYKIIEMNESGFIMQVTQQAAADINGIWFGYCAFGNPLAAEQIMGQVAV